MKTLIVEDDFTNRLFLQTFLSRYGECHIAVNGTEALKAFRMAAGSGSPYDLICMDIMMPEMDGQEALRQIRALEESRNVVPPQGVKIVMTTAVKEMKEVFRSFRALCDAYVVKPIDTAELLGKLRSLELIQ
ncbi:MAG TPA: response regulator [Bryobacteraceae bacterium]|nr:response regulator [Bryobacteraceae bacterium]